ncbi:hypothetical protein VNI00_004935 [Paramarasmius palmivorus]|uniref:Deoxyribonuclease NucA/NucB domain-containing protein n=1 Tax=Paramarasmius palmivorus TaxID=297713 RepID=A0AAW0DJI7_9AGAR
MLSLRTLAYLTIVVLNVSALPVTFDCNAMPETCNNMCYAMNRGVYNPMHFDSNPANRAGRRTAAGCKPNPNRCQNNPPTALRITCDEYPFASTHGTGMGGWYTGTGATTRCVSRAECSSQGGTLSAFYQSFGRVDGTLVQVMMINTGAATPYCLNPALAPDANFQTGIAPPNRRDIDGFATGGRPPSRRNSNATLYEYKTAANRTMLSISGPIDIGTKVFVPNLEWQNHPKVNGLLGVDADGDEDVCDDNAARVVAASMLEVDELGEFDQIVERV